LEYPELIPYEKTWPVTDLLKMYIKSTRAKLGTQTKGTSSKQVSVLSAPIIGELREFRRPGESLLSPPVPGNTVTLVLISRYLLSLYYKNIRLIYGYLALVCTYPDREPSTAGPKN
jgi:hypothetical protein